MSNPSKARGTRGETACVRWFRANGFPHTDRQPLRGNRDAGDLALTAGLVAEVKAVSKGGTGQPPAQLLGSWMAQAEAERVNAGAEYCLLIVKRAGTTDVGRWWCYLTVRDMGLLLAEWRATSAVSPDPVCMSVHTATQLLRAAGYGHPLDEETNDD